jgi:hypothetical protein
MLCSLAKIIAIGLTVPTHHLIIHDAGTASGTGAMNYIAFKTEQQHSIASG